MEHCAFIFDIDKFKKELAGELNSALSTGNTAGLKKIIHEHLNEIRLPYDGAKIDENWESELQYKDAHSYGDFAITKYYNPLEDEGLGECWLDLPEDLTKNRTPFLGDAFGPTQNYFDPGKEGSYFIEYHELKSIIHVVKKHLTESRLFPFKEEIENYLNKLQRAQDLGKGIYITF